MKRVETLVGLNVVDEATYQLYRDEMSPLLRRYGGGFRYDFKIAEVLKAETEAPINRVFTIYFPNDEASKAFFSDVGYLEIKARLFETSVADTTIIATYEPR